MSPVRTEIRALLALALPAAATQLSTMLMGFVDTVLLGHVGVHELASASIANVWIHGTLFFAFGVIVGIGQHARDHLALLGDAQPLFVAERFEIDLAAHGILPPGRLPGRCNAIGTAGEGCALLPAPLKEDRRASLAPAWPKPRGAGMIAR